MKQYRLYSFSMPSGEREIVVISDEPREIVVTQYATDGRTLDNELEIEGNAIRFPCDRELSAAH